MANLAWAVLGTAPLTVRLNGAVYAFPDRGARPWVKAVLQDPMYPSVLRLMTPDGYDGLMDRVEDGDASPAELRRIASLAVREAGGRPWWETITLVRSAFTAPSSGRLLGSLILRGVRLDDLTLAEFCAAVWARLTENADDKQLFKLEAQLSVPPPGADMEDLDESPDFAAVAARMRAMPGVRVG